MEISNRGIILFDDCMFDIFKNYPRNIYLNSLLVTFLAKGVEWSID